METAVLQNDLLALARLLQERLNLELPLAVPIQVKCVLQDSTLLVLGQNADDDDRTESIFSLLQDSVEALQITFPGSIWEETQRVRLYLRASGERQPFAAREFELEKSTDSNHFESEESDEKSILDNSLESIFKWDKETDEVEPSGKFGEKQDADINIAPASDAMESLSLEEPTTESRSESEPISEEEIFQTKADRSRKKLELSPSLIYFGAGVAAIVVLAGTYALTRPCAIGPCNVIQTAKQLNEASIKNFKTAKNEQDILKGKQNLTQAIQELDNIPFWSSYHSPAQKLGQTYRAQATKIDPVLIALDKAEIASEKSQDSLQTLQDWQAIQGIWQQAIASLNKVTPNTPVYPFAHRKFKEYQVNSNTIGQKIKQEKQAEAKLIVAKKTAQLAQVRQDAAKTLDHWQQVQSTWEAAINSLSAIPKNTIAYQETQQLLDSYRPNLATSRQRKSQEEISANIYNQAISIANLAKSYEQKSQWTQALATWRRASTYAQQVPENTFYYEKAKPLSDKYNNSLRLAQAKLQVAVVVQKADADLEKTCAGVPKICAYTVSKQIIKVYLMPAYVNGVRRTAMTAGLSGDARTLASVDDHLKTLQSALEAISENSGVPLEIYDEKRYMIGRYVP